MTWATITANPHDEHAATLAYRRARRRRHLDPTTDPQA
jgi:hypothetical protein